ncbi:hypothetical protein [Mycobacteroides abscessus]|uniref:hypothetical protein n=1 Tax=Mycobacteroides abscessus TaxID=36809 RepID=UPI00092B794B|nr:hypothetical protein [Mycobacteroides abscessus]SIL45264.1 Uncharacterised protein [Mycobacteroides abscessus subsp. abscessus]
MTGPEAVLGLDPSLARAGIAAIVRDQPGSIARPGVITHVGYSLREGVPWWRRSRRIITEAREIAAIIGEVHTATPIARAVIEGPAWASNLPSKFDRDGLWWALFSILDAKRIPVTVVNPTTRGKFITGRAPNGMKPGEHKKLVLAESQATWFDDQHRIKNHDQADALGLAHMGALDLGWHLPVDTRRRHVENIALVDWETEWLAS